ncbi:MAG TPA: shikimate kinase [Verrucomicrobiae bacterium]|nr:shikimate kinase [Verrucomicrobiae bacterium]
MSDARAIRNLALAGFMGTGKSSVGQLVAAQLHHRFVDTDDLIEARAGKSVTRVFEQEGEARFREHEAAVVEDLTTWQNSVIATGGGLVANEANLASLKTHALVICLWASPETIWERVKSQTHRPLLRTPDPQARIRELLAERAPFYRQADVLVNTELRSIKEVAHHVIHQFRMALGQTAHR